MTAQEWQYLAAGRLPWPVPWQDLFRRPGPLFLEVGFGNGQFLLGMAARRPEANLVGLEISQPSLRKTQRKVAVRRVDNVLLVHARADHALHTLFAPRAISGVVINFPDPWPKAAHGHRRLLSAGFLSLLASRMHAQATLDVATDDAAYAAHVTNRLTSCSQFESRLATPFTDEESARIGTKYEARALQQSRRCYYFKWQRTAVASTHDFPIPRELPMPHVILRPTTEEPATLPALARAFQPATHTTEWGAIRFVALFNAVDEPLLLIDAYIDEPFLTQRLALAIRSRADQSLVLSVHEIGFPRATPGVHQALRHLADDLIRHCPQLTISTSNLAT